MVAIPTLFILFTISFILVRSAPGNPFSTEAKLPPEVLKNIKAKYNLDKPLYVQYLYYLKDMATFNFGPSFKYKDHSVNELVAQALPVSIKIGFWAFVIAVLVGIIFGIVAAINQNGILDYFLMAISMIGIAVPNFVVAPLFIFIFAITYKIFPAGGWNGGSFMHIVLPVVAMSFMYTASIARITRASMIEVLNSPFIRTARAKGLGSLYIFVRHALKPALLPVVSYLGPAFVGVITGSVVIETIFSLPGIGQLFVNGALNRDYSMVLAITVIIGALMIFFNMLVDILYVFIDPKLRY